MPVILALPSAILIAILVILLEAGIQTLIDELRSASERRNKLKQLDVRVRVWTSLAAEEPDPVEKGYKTARLLNLAYEKSLAEAREKKETKI